MSDADRLANQLAERFASGAVEFGNRKQFVSWMESQIGGTIEHFVRAEQGWWHRKWHQDTGIPCDGGSEYCPMSQRVTTPQVAKGAERDEA